ncbi:hypothetical protein SRHO_G00292940 [Serrasalmus rhombeus]
MEILGKWQTVCQFGALALVVEFLVADIPLGILLGMDFLQKYGVVIDLGGKQCTIMGKRLTLLLREGGAHTYSVSVHNDVVIPPRSEVIISGIVEGLLGDSMECMFEPSSLTQGDIMIARVVCQTRGGFLPVRVLNVADNAQTLRQGMTLGTLDTAVEVEGTGEVMQRVDPKVGTDGWTIDDLVAQLRLDEKGFTSSQLQYWLILIQRVFILDTDASDFGIGAVLSQEVDGIERVIAYGSRALSKAERRYATTKKELLSMVVFTKYFKHYLLGREFILRTDHNSLRWLHNFQGLEGQLARWVEQLASFQYKIVHRPGRQHVNADALSRLPSLLANLDVEFSKKGEEPTSGGGNRLSEYGGRSTPMVQVVSQFSMGGGTLETESEHLPLEMESEGLALVQKGDPEIRLLIQLRKGIGGWVEVVQNHPSLQKYAQVWDQLQVQGDCLVRVAPSRLVEPAVVQIVLPKGLVCECEVYKCQPFCKSCLALCVQPKFTSTNVSEHTTPRRRSGRGSQGRTASVSW